MKPLSYEEISEKMLISVEEVYLIEQTALKKIKENIEKMGLKIRKDKAILLNIFNKGKNYDRARYSRNLSFL